MDNERCTAHGITRCTACAFLEAKKNKAKLTVTPPMPVERVKIIMNPPPSISNAPPEDIEMMDEREVNKAREAYDKELESLLEAKARNEAINAAADIPAEPDIVPRGVFQYKTETGQSIDFDLRTGQGTLVKSQPEAGFETLPVGDSHASKVMRAASAYADAARDYALKLASYTKVAEGLKTAAEKLTEAKVIRDKEEKELQALVAGGDK